MMTAGITGFHNRKHLANSRRTSIAVIVYLTCLLFSAWGPFASAAEESTNESNTEGTKKRVITREELAQRDGVKSETIWLSILGEVYDVSPGAKFYAPGGPYSIFAGKDGSVPFVTGVFTEEEACKPIQDTLSDLQIYALDTWRKSYQENEKYPFLGVLEGELYNSEGALTEVGQRVQEVIREQKLAAEKKEAERQERIRQRKLKQAEEDATKARGESVEL
jgi:predicted heme/steroid binding protein